MPSKDFNYLPAMAAKVHMVAKQLVKKAAFDVEAAAKGRAAVDTGFMRSAIYTVTPDARFNTGGHSTYGQGISGAGKLEPEIEHPPNDLTAYVVAGAEYSIYVEDGTRYMVAQPFMAPAAEDVRPSFEMAFAKLEEYLKGVK
jgi:HK97 gp10 family phage protein